MPKRINFLDLLIHLWPGDWRVNLQLLNRKMAERRHELKRKNNKKGSKEVSEKEWWIFWGIIISARVLGERGGNLYDNVGNKNEGLGFLSKTKLDLSKYMFKYRFKEIKRCIGFAWSDETKKEQDNWWQVAHLQEWF